MGTKPANQNKHLSPDRPHQRPLGRALLDNSTPLPPTILKEEKGGPSAWNTHEREPSPQSLSLELQPHHAAATQEPLKVSCGTQRNTKGKDSVEQSTQHLRPEEQSIASLSSRGYEGDKENSDGSLVSRGRALRLSKKLNTQVDSTQSSELFTPYSPSPPKIHLLKTQATRAIRLEGKSEASLPASSTTSLGSVSFLSPGSSFLTYQVSSGLLSSTSSQLSSHPSSSLYIKVDGGRQSESRSTTSLQEDKAGDKTENSSLITQGEQPA